MTLITEIISYGVAMGCLVVLILIGWELHILKKMKQIIKKWVTP